MISPWHSNQVSAISLGRSDVTRKVSKILMRHCIIWLELCCALSAILTYLVLAWYGIVLMDSRWQCCPLLAAWVGDYLEQVMVAPVSYASWLMCEYRTSALVGNSPYWPRDGSGDHCLYFPFLDRTNMDALDTLGVHPISGQFWHYPLCNVYQLWQHDDSHQLLLSFVRVLLPWLLRCLKARKVNDQFNNGFTSVPQYPGLQNFATPIYFVNSESC